MKKLPVGIQVYGLRDLLENTPERFPEVMRQVREMGYDIKDSSTCYWRMVCNSAIQ